MRPLPHIGLLQAVVLALSIVAMCLYIYIGTVRDYFGDKDDDED